MRKWVGAELERGTYVLSITDENFFTSNNYVKNGGDGTDLCQPL